MDICKNADSLSRLRFGIDTVIGNRTLGDEFLYIAISLVRSLPEIGQERSHQIRRLSKPQDATECPVALKQHPVQRGSVISLTQGVNGLTEFPLALPQRFLRPSS